MSRSILLVATLLLLLANSARARELRVCADPNNLPFSNAAGQGFENRIVALIARDLGATVTYTWWAQRRGFARHTLKAGLCDLWPGVAVGVPGLLTTSPYYRSTYVFVTRADRNIHVNSLDNPRLRTLRVGVQMIGNDANNTPPAQALARRGIVQNVRGYSVFGDYRQPNPASSIIAAVARGDIDVAIAWGPLAGYFAARAATALHVEPVRAGRDAPIWPMSFAIAMGVAKNTPSLRREIDDALAHDRTAIAAILSAYNVPLVP